MELVLKLSTLYTCHLMHMLQNMEARNQNRKVWQEVNQFHPHFLKLFTYMWDRPLATEWPFLESTRFVHVNLHKIIPYDIVKKQIDFWPLYIRPSKFLHKHKLTEMNKRLQNIEKKTTASYWAKPQVHESRFPWIRERDTWKTKVKWWRKRNTMKSEERRNGIILSTASEKAEHKSL